MTDREAILVLTQGIDRLRSQVAELHAELERRTFGPETVVPGTFVRGYTTAVHQTALQKLCEMCWTPRCRSCGACRCGDGS